MKPFQILVGRHGIRKKLLSTPSLSRSKGIGAMMRNNSNNSNSNSNNVTPSLRLSSSSHWIVFPYQHSDHQQHHSLLQHSNVAIHVITTSQKRMKATTTAATTTTAAAVAATTVLAPQAGEDIVVPPPPPFQYTKSQQLFDRIVSTMTVDDIPRLQSSIDEILGRTFRVNEFYYRSFGRGGSNSSSTRTSRGGGRNANDDASNSAADDEVAVVVEKTSFDVKLLSFDATSKIKVIKEVRATVTNLGLKEAKELVENVPKVLQKGVTKEQAEEIKTKLQAVGAVIEIV
jgi:large subunit ribosomal protein L7/L12